MSNFRDYYRILHVQPDAPTEIIQASYRTLMQRLRNHPDLGGDHEHAVLLNEAHAVLADPERRAAYDRERAAEIATENADDTPRRDGAEADSTTGIFAAQRCLFCGAPHGLQRAIGADDQCNACASPLFPSERFRLDYSGQRMLTRIPKRRAVALYTSWPQAEAFTAEMRDLSLNGMQLRTTLKLALDQIVKIDSPVCRALARVAYCRRDRQFGNQWIVGVEFLTLRFANTRGSFVSASA